MNSYYAYTQTYTCESGALARIIIPHDATEDDLKGIAELLGVVIKRHFKLELGGKS